MTPEEYAKEIQRLWPAARAHDPLTLWRALRRAECALHRYAEIACNREMRAWEIRAEERTVERVKTLLWGEDATSWPTDTPKLHFNSDPRGYALKVSDAWMREHRDCRLRTDWGGYGLLAPGDL